MAPERKLPPQCMPKPVTDPDQRAYLKALDRYVRSHHQDDSARIDMLIALTRMLENPAPKEEDR